MFEFLWRKTKEEPVVDPVVEEPKEMLGPINAKLFAEAVNKTDFMTAEAHDSQPRMVCLYSSVIKGWEDRVFFDDDDGKCYHPAFYSWRFESQKSLSMLDLLPDAIRHFEILLKTLARHEEEIASLPKERWLLVIEQRGYRSNKEISYNVLHWTRHQSEITALDPSRKVIVEHAIRVDVPVAV